MEEDDPPMAWGDDLTPAEEFAAVLAVCTNAPEGMVLDVRVCRVRGLFQAVELVWCRGPEGGFEEWGPSTDPGKLGQ